MRSTIRQISSVRCSLWLGLLAVLVAGGCNEMINPTLDDVPASREVCTASVAGVRQAGVAPALRTRGLEPAYTFAQDGTVSHWPLWWEDPFVDRGSDDGQFAWTWEDGVAVPYGLGRSLVNTMGWPISAVVTPPLTVMGSDGTVSRQALGYDHDAARLPGGVTPPVDILEVGTVAPEAEPTVEPAESAG